MAVLAVLLLLLLLLLLFVISVGSGRSEVRCSQLSQHVVEVIVGLSCGLTAFAFCVVVFYTAAQAAPGTWMRALAQ
jgi:hypothetical protein